MSEKIGPVTFSRGEEHPFLGRKLATEKTFSEQMAWLIDQEIEKIVKKGETIADKIILENRQALETLAVTLLEEEVLGRERIDELLTKYGIVKHAN
jgi:cell division protease FtsH